jgi:hypothetical protein
MSSTSGATPSLIGARRRKAPRFVVFRGVFRLFRAWTRARIAVLLSPPKDLFALPCDLNPSTPCGAREVASLCKLPNTRSANAERLGDLIRAD